MNSVNPSGPPEPHVFDLLDRALRVLRGDLMRRLPDDGRALRTSHRRLLSMVPEAGVRVGDLAQRAGMTAQAVGEFARDLERLGLMSSGPDPADRRARLLRLTPAGRAVTAESDAAIRAMETDQRGRLGDDTWDELRRALDRLGS